MESSELTSLFISFTSITFGTLLGVIGNKLLTDKLQTSWKWAFYILGISSLLSVPLYYYLILETNIIGNLVIINSIVCGLLLIYFTYKFLDIKSIFKSNELDPIINKFTSASDHQMISLFGGDLSFFGSTPSDIDKNSQYKHLISINFNTVHILCEFPSNKRCKIRYGKILSDINGIKLKFYNPKDADLKIRGRMKTFQGVEKLLIYSKIDSGIYQTIETDTANSNGALYSNIWKLVWSLASEISVEQAQEYKQLYRTNK